MAVYHVTEGYKITIVTVTLENTGTAAADISDTITVSELKTVLHILGVVREDTNNTGIVAKPAGDNKIDVTAQSVPAGAKTTFKLVVLGY